MSFAADLPLAANLVVFAILAVAIWIAGTRLSYLADAIGDRTGVGHAVMGLLFLAGITSLPELVTTSAAAVAGEAALAVSNLFGGITMQTAILAVADAVAIRVTLTSFPRKPTPILEGALLVLLLASTLMVMSVGELPLLYNVGLGTTALAGVYVLSIFVLNAYDRDHAWRPIDLPEPGEDEERPRTDVPESLSLRMLALQSCGVGLVILVCGVLLVDVSSALAEQTGLGSSFIGVTLLATTTSLPELSTTIAAVRMGAYTMAISNIFGSNLIMVFVLFPADVLYRQGEILEQADSVAQLALLSGIVVTTIYIVGLLMKKKPRVLGMGLDSILVLIAYLASLYAFYLAR